MTHDRPKPLLERSWPIVVVGLAVAGMLGFLAWQVARPDIASRDES